MIDQLTQAHDQAQAQYQKIQGRVAMLDEARKELGNLRNLGDLVDQDDVLHAAGNLVKVGFTPQALAGLLADMPTNQQGMATWVEGLWAMMAQREQQLMPLVNQARFRLGTSAIQLLAGHHIADALQSQAPAQQSMTPSQPGQPDQSNPMTPQAGAPTNG